MSDQASPPKIFAHHVIKQMVSHLLAEDMVIEPRDYHAMRVTFRWLGGSWDKLGAGDIVMLELLKQVVTAWGQMDGRVRESDQLI